MPELRRGVRMGIDVGDVRIGVARSDPQGLMALPVATIKAGKTAIAEISAMVTEYEALEVIVGSPLSLSGKVGPAALKAQNFAGKLADAINPVPVRLIDERLTTVQAQRGLTEAGISTRQGRSVVDQAAAVIIVQTALDAESASGAPPGTIVRTT